MLVLAVSVLMHGLVLTGAYYLPGLIDLGASRELPFEVMTVQLIGSLEPPAPAAPAAPVDPSLQGPNVVELPKTDPIVPQPTPLEQMITPVIPTEAIPIGERPPDQPIEPVVKATEPPPKVAPPPKPVVEDQPKPKPRAQRPNPEANLNRSIDEIRRRVEADKADDAINSAIGDIAKRQGRGNGTSSNEVGSSSQGNFADPAKVPYYAQIREIVRSNWVPPAGAMAENLSVQFGIVIQPDGRISARRLIRTSGTSEFDQSVEQAINRSNFPPLPPAFGGQEDRPIMAFSYNDLSRR
jgi:outer membrane biosynthesis protein TonB